MQIRIIYENESFIHECCRYQLVDTGNEIYTFSDNGDVCGLFRGFRAFEVVSTPSFGEVSEDAELIGRVDKANQKEAADGAHGE